MVDFAKLKAPFDSSVISWRVGSVTKDKTKGMALAYLDARAVMDRLDEVCGPDGWQCKYSHAAAKTICDIGIQVGPTDYAEAVWVWKADGAGDSDIEAEKGALSDAFKRAAVRWGIGRYLYELDSPWVALDEWKRIQKGEYAKLDAVLARHSAGLPAAKSYPVQPDVVAGTARWVQDQKTALLNYGSKEEIVAWGTRETIALKKLHKDDLPAWESLKEARDLALDRVRAPL